MTSKFDMPVTRIKVKEDPCIRTTMRFDGPVHPLIPYRFFFFFFFTGREPKCTHAYSSKSKKCSQPRQLERFCGPKRSAPTADFPSRPMSIRPRLYNMPHSYTGLDYRKATLAETRHSSVKEKCDINCCTRINVGRKFFFNDSQN